MDTSFPPPAPGVAPACLPTYSRDLERHWLVIRPAPFRFSSFINRLSYVRKIEFGRRGRFPLEVPTCPPRDAGPRVVKSNPGSRISSSLSTSQQRHFAFRIRPTPHVSSEYHPYSRYLHPTHRIISPTYMYICDRQHQGEKAQQPPSPSGRQRGVRWLLDRPPTRVGHRHTPMIQHAKSTCCRNWRTLAR